jgi:hypothetical protein
MKIRFDGKEYDVSKPEEALALQHAADKVRGDATRGNQGQGQAGQARADQAESDLKKAQADRSLTPRALTRRWLRASSSRPLRARVLGGKFEPKGKSDREIMVAVVRGDAKEFKDDGKSDDYVRSRFDAVCEKGVRVDSITSVITKVNEVKAGPREDAGDVYDPEKARNDMREANENAWNKSAEAAN